MEMHWYRCSTKFTKFPTTYIIVYSRYTYIYTWGNLYLGVCAESKLLRLFIHNKTLYTNNHITGLKKIIYNYIFKTGFLPCQIIVTVFNPKYWGTLITLYFVLKWIPSTHHKLYTIASINILINYQI